MKKILILLLALTMVFALAACGDDTTDPTNPTTGNNEQKPTNGNDPTEGGNTAADEYSFNYKGTVITLHADFAPILAVLGEPVSYTESASCAFEGLDKTYYYGSLYIDTYPDGDKDRVYDFWFADDSLTTAEGIYIGSTQADVEAAYGTAGYNGANAYIMTKGTGTLTIILDNGVVTSIQYAIALG